MIKVVHLSSLHSRYDTRIFVKMCVSLSRAGYQVTYIVADGKGVEEVEGVKIIDVGLRAPGRLTRMRQTSRQVMYGAVEQDADVYHVHDPELIPVGLRLKRLGKIVIFDAHEDLPEQIKNKAYLHPLVRSILSKSSDWYQKRTCARFDAIIAATPLIASKFIDINAESVNVNNFPILDEIEYNDDWSDRRSGATYLGGMAAVRGIKEIIRAIALTPGTRLNLAGKFSESDTEAEVKSYPEWGCINELGFLDRDQVKALLSRSICGLVVLHPISNYIDALPVKMFEYMASGLPVIASDFPLWRDIVEGNKCGLCVDPLDVHAIANAIQYIVDHPEIAQEMGRNGRLAIEEKFNWSSESDKLLDLYGRLVN
ncbi:MAG: glycosyltransferase family 4 protein [Pseudomonadota bacterium]